MATMQKLENPNNLASLLQGGTELAKLFSSKTTTTSPRTDTQQTAMSQEGLDAVLKQILESNQGLAAVARGQRGSGLYNSNVNTLLTNNLLSKAAGEVAKINAPTITTRGGGTEKTSAPLGISTALGTVAAGTLLNNLIKSDTVKDIFAKKAASSLGTGLSAGASGAQGLDVSSFLGESFAGDALGTGISASASATSSDFTGGGPLNLASAAFNVLSADDKGAALERAVGSYVGNLLLPGFGGPIGAAVAEPIFEAGYDILGGVENVGSTLVEGFGDVVVDPIVNLFKGGCFLTTAIVTLLGKADDCEELQILRGFRDSWLKEHHPENITAYYELAPKILVGLEAVPEKDQLLLASYDTYIAPAVEAIKAGDSDLAYSFYCNLVLTLSKAAGLATPSSFEEL